MNEFIYGKLIFLRKIWQNVLGNSIEITNFLLAKNDSFYFFLMWDYKILLMNLLEYQK